MTPEDGVAVGILANLAAGRDTRRLQLGNGLAVCFTYPLTRGR